MNSSKWSLIAAVVAGVLTGIYLNATILQIFGPLESLDPWVLAIFAGVIGGGIYYFVERPLHQLFLVVVAVLAAWFAPGPLGAVALAFVLGSFAAFAVSLVAGRKF